MMMYGWSDTMVFGPVHWLFFIVVVAVNLAALWVRAFIDWPEHRGPR